MLNRSMETKHFSAFYEESDGNIMEQIVALIDDTYDRTVKRFELKADNLGIGSCCARTERPLSNGRAMSWRLIQKTPPHDENHGAVFL